MFMQHKQTFILIICLHFKGCSGRVVAEGHGQPVTDDVDYGHWEGFDKI